MRRDDVRFAAAARDDGLRKISKFTWRAGAAGVACSALIAVAFGHHIDAQQPASVHGGTSGSTGSTAGSSGSTGSTARSSGSSGSTGSTGSGGASSSGSSGTIVVPAQPPAPSSGSGQVTSGAT
jgi:hypothetical protein